jgi:hypothetical protein
MACLRCCTTHLACMVSWLSRLTHVPSNPLQKRGTALVVHQHSLAGVGQVFSMIAGLIAIAHDPCKQGLFVPGCASPSDRKAGGNMSLEIPGHSYG